MSSKNKTLSAAVGIFDNEIEGVIRKIPIKSIKPAKIQPRQNKDINIQALASSLKDNGLLQPIVVTKHEDHYTIIAGERRYHAANSIGWGEIECRILNKNERDTYKLAVIENLQRENLDPWEESLAYKRLKEQFTYNDTELSEIIGKSRNYISEILSISEVPLPLLQKAKQEGITSKNLLIQFAMAVKKGIPHEFVENFKEGNISSVKSAKEYLQRMNEKLDTNILREDIVSEPQEDLGTIESIENLNHSDIQVNVKKNSAKGTISITIETPPVKLKDMSLESIEISLKNTLNTLIERYLI